MKKLNLLLLLVCSVLFLSQSCKDDTCPETNCNTGVINTETCVCDCPTGFSGTNCETEDLCVTQSVDCKNGGTCIDGTCDCPDGYIGTNCETEDLCVMQNVDCKNGGTCTDGICDCLNGYEGSDCSELWKDKYLHNDYTVAVVCGSDTNYFFGRISSHSSDDLKIKLHIVDQIEFTLNANLLTSTTFEVPEQELIQGLPSVSGPGSIDENGVVTVILTTMGNDPCTYTYTR